VVGAVDGERAISGVELSLDSLLQGVTGSRQLLKTGRGDRLASPDAPLVEPVAGHDITLTLNYTLQDIAERALDRAITETDADGGDVVVLNPGTGEILALASRSRTGYATKLTAVTDVYEPGSTVKPFVVGRLLAEGQTRLDETLNTYNGSWNYRGLRTLTDTHREPNMTVSEILQYSSNIGIVQLADRLGPRGEYGLFRDLGFGNATGVSVPAESPGLLKPVSRWSKLTASSMAFGYELLVTPLQMALAYGAIANDGVLMHPSVIREIRAPDGRTVWRHTPRPVRTVFPARVARLLRESLTGTVEMGTAQSAALGRYRIAGKTGTAYIAKNGSYAAREYSASFVGLFPAEKPQLVILAKIERPRGPEHVGGLVAAPVLKAVVEGALAAPTSPLNRTVLAQQLRPSVPTDSGVEVVASSEATPVLPMAAMRRVRPSRADSVDGSSTYAIALASQLAPATPVATVARAVPDVRGLSLRDAVWVVHNAGFKAVVDSAGTDVSTPAAGAMLTPGSLVRIHRVP
jgi:cell division protein FtsI (penicillin-binding protein 3)